jgi:hypothetical protein
MPMRSVVAASACALALLAAACGGDTTSSASGTESAATVAPASATGYIAIGTDLDSDQWKQVEDLAGRFPGRDRLLDAIERKLDAENIDLARDVEPALGPETAIVFLDGKDEVVALTQPDDQAKLEALLDRADDDYVTREIDGWTAIAETQATLDAFAREREAGTLDGDDRFQEAIADLPEEAFAKAYVTGEGVDEAAGSLSRGSDALLTGGGRLVSVVAALEALDEGAKLGGVVRSEGGKPAEPYEPKLLERVSDDALLVLSFRDLNRTIQQARENESVGKVLADVERLLGVTFDELGRLFVGESVLYVRAGLLVPEVTLLLDVDDTETALATLDRLAARIAPLVDGKLGTTDADGVQQKYVEISGVRISYAAFDGLVAITSGARGIRDARSDGDKLPDDDRFRDAKEAAGLGDETSGFLYADLKDAIPLLEGLAGITGTSLPSGTTANLDPLETFLVHASQDGDEVRFSGFLGVS